MNKENGFTECDKCRGKGFTYKNLYTPDINADYVNCVRRIPCMKCKGEGQLTWLDQVFTESNYLWTKK